MRSCPRCHRPFSGSPDQDRKHDCVKEMAKKISLMAREIEQLEFKVKIMWNDLDPLNQKGSE